VTGRVFATIPVSEARPGDLLARFSFGGFFDVFSSRVSGRMFSGRRAVGAA
jgi:hypothetical protein